MAPVTKEAHTFYSLMALLRCSDKFAEYLVSAGINGALKRDLNLLRNFIGRLVRTCDNSLSGADKATWSKEWSERDYELFSSVFFMLNDMTDDQRAATEALIEGIRKGEVKFELEKI